MASNERGSTDDLAGSLGQTSRRIFPRNYTSCPIVFPSCFCMLLCFFFASWLLAYWIFCCCFVRGGIIEILVQITHSTWQNSFVLFACKYSMPSSKHRRRLELTLSAETPVYCCVKLLFTNHYLPFLYREKRKSVFPIMTANKNLVSLFSALVAHEDSRRT